MKLYNTDKNPLPDITPEEKELLDKVRKSLSKALSKEIDTVGLRFFRADTLSGYLEFEPESQFLIDLMRNLKEELNLENKEK